MVVGEGEMDGSQEAMGDRFEEAGDTAAPQSDLIDRSVQ